MAFKLFYFFAGCFTMKCVSQSKLAYVICDIVNGLIVKTLFFIYYLQTVNIYAEKPFSEEA